MRAGGQQRLFGHPWWLLLAFLLPAIFPFGQAQAVETNTGSAQPYMGYVAAGPFVFKNGAKRLVIEVAVRFKPSAEAIISSAAFGSAEKKRLNLEIYATVLKTFLDEGTNLDRDSLKIRIGQILDTLLNTSAVEEVAFSRFDAR
jgi:flagellar basal body-associated protein FliL